MSVNAGTRSGGARALVANLAMVTLTVLLLAGCTTAGQSPSPPESALATGDFSTTAQAEHYARAHGYTQMAQILSDGRVSRDEYVESFDSWASCMQRAGVVFDAPAPTWNPTDNLSLIRSWQGSTPTQTRAQQAKCWAQYDYVKKLFDQTTPPETDPQLMTFTISCLQAKKIKLADTDVTNYTALVKENPSSSVANSIPGCVETGIKQLYPMLHGYSLSF